MEKRGMFKDSQIIILGLCIAGATIISSLILSKGVLKVMKFSQQVINVTGAAQKNITSDYIVWVSWITRREADLPTAYKNLKEDLDTVLTYLESKGIRKEEIITSQITTSRFSRKQRTARKPMMSRRTNCPRTLRSGLSMWRRSI